MDKKEVMGMIQDILDGLKAGDIIEEDIKVKDEMVLIGNGAILDSIAFVTFFMELEDHISITAQKEIFLTLDDLADLESASGLTIQTLTSYIIDLTK